MRTVLCWVSMQRIAVIPYRYFRTIYQSHLQGSQFSLDSWPLKMGSIGCPETSVKNYHYSLHNNPEECSSCLLHGWTWTHVSIFHVCKTRESVVFLTPITKF
jgi:hypothetical protein